MFGDNFVQSSVESLDMEHNKVVLDGGREIMFSHCVIAVGSLGPVPARSEKVWFGKYLINFLRFYSR